MNLDKNKGIIAFFFVFLLLNIISVSALTASIGNGRMVLKAEIGDTLNKYVKVINSNDVPVTITLSVDGDLKDDITLAETEFILQPGEDRKAYFTIDVKKAGTTESYINVAFSSVGETNATGTHVGLHSTVIVIAVGEGEVIDEDTADVEEEDNAENSILNSLTGNVSGLTEGIFSSESILLLISSLVLIFLFVVLMFILKKKKGKINNRKRSVRSE